MDTLLRLAAVAAVFVISGGVTALYVILESEKRTPSGLVQADPHHDL